MEAGEEEEVNVSNKANPSGFWDSSNIVGGFVAGQGACRIGESVYIVWAKLSLIYNLSARATLNPEQTRRRVKMTPKPIRLVRNRPTSVRGVARIPKSNWVDPIQCQAFTCTSSSTTSAGSSLALSTTTM